MYFFWHLLFASSLALLLCTLLKRNPSKLIFFATTSAGVLPDLDHLLIWTPELLTRLFPTYLWEGLTFSMRTDVYPCILHLWIWPLALCVTGFLLRGKKYQAYVLAGAAGWMLHLTLDGAFILV